MMQGISTTPHNKKVGQLETAGVGVVAVVAFAAGVDIVVVFVVVIFLSTFLLDSSGQSHGLVLCCWGKSIDGQCSNYFQSCMLFFKLFAYEKFPGPTYRSKPENKPPPPTRCPASTPQCVPPDGRSGSPFPIASTPPTTASPGWYGQGGAQYRAGGVIISCACIGRGSAHPPPNRQPNFFLAGDDFAHSVSFFNSLIELY